ISSLFPCGHGISLLPFVAELDMRPSSKLLYGESLPAKPTLSSTFPQPGAAIISAAPRCFLPISACRSWRAALENCYEAIRTTVLRGRESSRAHSRAPAGRTEPNL